MKCIPSIRRVFPVFLSVVLLVSTLYVGTMISEIPASATTDETVEQVGYATKNVLTEHDYSDAKTYDLTDEDSVWSAQNALKASSQAVFPVADPLGGAGGVLTYKQQIYEDGAVYLGADYTSASNVKSQAIQVTPGETYAVKFDYYTTGNTGTKPLKVELTVGNTIDNVMTSLTEGAVSIINIASDQDLTMSGWTTTNATITVPKDIDTDVYTYLMLRVTYGAGSDASGAIYFDNVEVAEASLTSNYILADTDFTDANDTEDDMYEHSQAFRSGEDPLDATNKVLMKKSGYDVGGAVYLGMDYKDDTSIDAIANEAIQVEAGKTYTVQFDYYYDCSEYWNESPVYLTAGKTYVANADKYPWDFKYGIEYDEDIAVTVFTTEAYSAMEGWETAKFSIAFPEDYNTTTYPYLMLYNGTAIELCELYIDNIKVTEAVSSEALTVYDDNMCVNNYSDANDTEDDMYEHSQAFRSGEDPLDATNKVLMKKSGYDVGGAVYLGMDYKDDKTFDAIAREAIRVEAGKTYTVQFDYYYDCSEYWNESPVYLTAGKTYVANADKYPWDFKYGIEYDADIAVTVFTTEVYSAMEGWETAKFSITFPENYDTTTYPYLMLYNGTGNELCELYIDNTEVTVPAPVAVNYTIGDETNCEVFYDGIFDSAAFNTETDSVMWYSDEACTKSFNQSSIEDSDELQVFELYGIYENATAAFVKGDIDLNNIVNDSDMKAIRSEVLGGAELPAITGRADVNSDKAVDVRDLVRIKKTLKGDVMSDFTINNNSLANYTIVTPNAAGYDYELVTSRINDLADLIKTANGRTNVDVIKEDNVTATEYEIIVGNAARVGVRTDLAENSYVVIPVGNKLYVNGGSESALGAALESLMGYIHSGNPISQDSFIAFEYIANTKLTNPALTVLSEDFNTDMAAGTMIDAARSPYANFFPKDACDWFLNDGREVEGTNTAFSSNNIWASNGSLIMDASGPTEITFTNAGVSDTRTAYVGAEIRGKAFTYGYAEMRAKLDVCNRVCPSFWLIGNSAGGTEEHYYEIDVFECFGAASQESGMVKGSLIEYTRKDDGTYSSLELESKYQLLNGVESRYINGFANDGKFHKYAVEWTEDYIYFIYDDVRVMRMQLEEGQFSRELTPVFTIYSGVDVVDDNIHTIDTTKATTDDEWANSSSFEIDYVKIYSNNFSD